MTARPVLDTRLPVARKYSIWCEMFVLRDIACNKLAAYENERQCARGVKKKYKLQNFIRVTARKLKITVLVIL